MRFSRLSWNSGAAMVCSNTHAHRALNAMAKFLTFMQEQGWVGSYLDKTGN